MQIHIKLYGTLRHKLPRTAKGKATLDLTTERTVHDLMAKLDITQDVLIAVNDQQEVDDNYLLQDGDQVVVFPPTAGG